MRLGERGGIAEGREERGELGDGFESPLWRNAQVDHAEGGDVEDGVGEEVRGGRGAIVEALWVCFQKFVDHCVETMDHEQGRRTEIGAKRSVLVFREAVD
jgi:hypothetical protein